MVDIPLLAMVIASAFSLIIARPQKASQEALRALMEYDEVESVHASGAKLTADPGYETFGSKGTACSRLTFEDKAVLKDKQSNFELGTANSPLR